MADEVLQELVKKLKAVFIFAGDIVKTSEPEYASIGWRSTRALEADASGPVWSFERVWAAAALWRMNNNLILVPSGGQTNVGEGKTPSPPISSVIAFELGMLGVPAKFVLEEPGAFNSRQQVENCASVARRRGWLGQIAILAPYWQFARICALIVNLDTAAWPFAVGVTPFISMERALAAEDPIWNKQFVDWYASPVAREMFAKEVLGAGQLWTGHQPQFPKPFRGFDDPLKVQN